jgi:cytochrome c biogenesis protein
VLRIGERRWELQPGGSVELPEGRIEYRGLRGWMGYSVFYDWTIPWLLAASLVAIGALGAHFWSKFAAKPWNAQAQ